MSSIEKILIIDNYDSFIYNLVDEFKQAGCEVTTFRNDVDYQVLCQAVEDLKPSLIVLSPGPGHPREAGHCLELIHQFGDQIPFLGICLGHQALACAFGGTVERAPQILHGKASQIEHEGFPFFSKLDQPFRAGRYHSLHVSKLPEEMETIAHCGDLIMALRHKTKPLFGVQFHPESFLTPQGPQLIQDFLKSLKDLPEKIDFSFVLNQLVSQKDLKPKEFRASFLNLISGQCDPSQAAAYLMALRAKGETPQEIAQCVEILQEQALSLNVSLNHLVDNCGTGGDGAQTFNISTAAAFVVAGAGAPVAKHGNRRVSSQSGSADVLEQLGVSIDLAPDQVTQAIQSCGLGFLFARQYHPAMKHVAPVRKSLGVRTVFNILGPLLNPARVKRQVIGVFDPKLLQTVAEVLKLLGHHQALVVHGGGLDEFALHDLNQVAELKEGQVTLFEVTPEEFGFKRVGVSALKGGDPRDNAKLLEEILSGENQGPCRDVVLFNAGAAIYVSGLAKSFQEGIQKARNSIEQGKAMGVLEKLRSFSSSGEAANA